MKLWWSLFALQFKWVLTMNFQYKYDNCWHWKFKKGDMHGDQVMRAGTMLERTGNMLGVKLSYRKKAVSAWATETQCQQGKW